MTVSSLRVVKRSILYMMIVSFAGLIGCGGAEPAVSQQAASKRIERTEAGKKKAEEARSRRPQPRR